jgi:acyl dehydratase
MPLNYEAVRSWQFAPVTRTYTATDTILYALSVGVGFDATDTRQLRLVYEDGLRALPTMALVLGSPGLWLSDPRTGVDWRRMLHGEQRLVIHHPLPAAGSVVARNRVDGVVDKGEGRGALVYTTRDVHDAATDLLLASQTSTSFCRADGGFGGPSASVYAANPVPTREPDITVDMPTLAQQALLYRLNGDLNPLHADPAAAELAGFPRPILHGLCTMGVAGVALLTAVCDSDPHRLRALDVRFSSPVFPGETIRVSVWREAPGRAAFRAHVVERGACVLDNGSCAFVDG